MDEEIPTKVVNFLIALGFASAKITPRMVTNSAANVAVTMPVKRANTILEKSLGNPIFQNGDDKTLHCVWHFEEAHEQDMVRCVTLQVGDDSDECIISLFEDQVDEFLFNPEGEKVSVSQLTETEAKDALRQLLRQHRLSIEAVQEVMGNIFTQVIFSEDEPTDSKRILH